MTQIQVSLQSPGIQTRAVDGTWLSLNFWLDKPNFCFLYLKATDFFFAGRSSNLKREAQDSSAVHRCSGQCRGKSHPSAAAVGSQGPEKTSAEKIWLHEKAGKQNLLVQVLL